MGIFDIKFFSWQSIAHQAVAVFLEAGTTGEPENYSLVMGLPSLH